MLVAWTLLAGCQQDLLLALGDPTGINLPRVEGGAASLEEGTLSPSAILIRSNEAPAPAPAAPTPDQGAVEAPDAATAAPPPAPTFNPISIPEDAPEGTGVRWEGVKQKGQGRPSAPARYGKNGQPID